MSVSSGGDDGLDFELNLAPIIDCFTVLITFLLVSTSFLSMSVLEAGIAVEGAPSSIPATPPLSVIVQLNQNHMISYSINGPETASKQLVAREGRWDFDSLLTDLKSLKDRRPEFKGLTLTAENSIEYQEVVTVLEAIKPVTPEITLGGF